MKRNTLEVVGYKNQQVPNTFITQPTPTQHLGILLPGYRHSVDKAHLHYAGRILLEQGADLLKVEYAYFDTNFLEQPESERENWLSSDVFAICNTALAQRAYNQITLVGKSLGTLAMALLLEDSRFQSATCVWLTPLLTVEWLCSCIEQVKPRSLFVTGTADHYYKPDILERLEAATKGRAEVIEGVHHNLEIPGSISESLSALRKIVEAIDDFLNEGANRI